MCVKPWNFWCYTKLIIETFQEIWTNKIIRWNTNYAKTTFIKLCNIQTILEKHVIKIENTLSGIRKTDITYIFSFYKKRNCNTHNPIPFFLCIFGNFNFRNKIAQSSNQSIILDKVHASNLIIKAVHDSFESYYNLVIRLVDLPIG